MNINRFKECMQRRDTMAYGEELTDFMTEISRQNQKIVSKINNGRYDMIRIRKLMSKLTGQKIPDDFRIHLPFYTDFGRNITFGKNVFVNSGCCFQDQGGITIGNNTLIGHNVVLATLNHDIAPQKRADLIPAPITIGKNVWIGSNSTILPGVTIGDNAIIGAGSVVTKNVEKNTIVAGNPARYKKTIPQP